MFLGLRKPLVGLCAMSEQSCRLLLVNSSSSFYTFFHFFLFLREFGFDFFLLIHCFCLALRFLSKCCWFQSFERSGLMSSHLKYESRQFRSELSEKAKLYWSEVPNLLSSTMQINKASNLGTRPECRFRRSNVC